MAEPYSCQWPGCEEEATALHHAKHGNTWHEEMYCSEHILDRTDGKSPVEASPTSEQP